MGEPAGIMRHSFVIFCLLVMMAVSAFCQTPAARIHDEITNFCCEHFRSVMDDFFAQVTNNPDLAGHIIIYEGSRHDICSTKRQAARGEIDEIVRTIRNHIKFRGVDPKVFSVVKGGYRESWHAEFWVVPEGAAIPNPGPTHSSKRVNYAKRRTSRLDLRCP